MSHAPATLDDLRDALRRFAAARDWEQFHTPKNLAMALAVAAAELLEEFQWLTPAQSARLDARARRKVADEIDAVASARRKMRINARKYPVRRAKGNARKYSEL